MTIQAAALEPIFNLVEIWILAQSVEENLDCGLLIRQSLDQAFQKVVAGRKLLKLFDSREDLVWGLARIWGFLPKCLAKKTRARFVGVTRRLLF